jgi:hypothetical protein
MTNISDAIKKFEETLIKYNLPNLERLNPPLPEEVSQEILQQLEIYDEDFKSIYLWRDGYNFYEKSSNLCQIFTFGTFIPLRDIVEEVSSNRVNSRWDDEHLIPVITDSTGQYLLFNNRVGSDFGKVFLYSASILQAIDPISYFDSILSLLKTSITAYEQGVFKYDASEDWLEIDFMKFRMLAKNLNPNSDYWTL